MIAAIIQARMGSSRLPGKVLMSIHGKPFLHHIVDRLSMSQDVEKIIIATSSSPQNNKIAELAKELEVSLFRGSEDDVLDRYYKSAKKFKVNDIVRITADSPLLDPQMVDKVVKMYIDSKNIYDYVSNIHPPSFPDGLDVEVFSFDVLERAWKEAKKSYEREHVTPYMWENPEKFRVGNYSEGLDYSNLRLTLDDPKDLRLIKIVYENLYQKNKNFNFADILDFLKLNPELANINKDLGRYEGFIKSKELS